MRFDQIKRIIDGSGLTEDAGETAFFARELEHMYTKTYDILYPEYKARTFIPVDHSVPAGAETWNYKQFDEMGEAALISNYADDLPNNDVKGTEFRGGVRGIGASYAYSIQDLRAAKMGGRALDQKRADAAKRRIESKIDSLAATGDSAYGFSGLLNHASVPIVALAAAGVWSGKTSAQILDDLNKLVNSIFILSNGLHTGNTVILPPDQYALIATKRVDAVSEVTILQHFLKTNPWVRNVDYWHRCDGAGVGPSDRAVAYDRNPNNLEMVIPQEFEQFPPQAKGLSFTIFCHARFGGLKVPYPKAIAYMDGI